MRKTFLAIVTWEAAQQNDGQGLPYVRLDVESVGWVVKNDAQAVTLAAWHTINDKNGSSYYSDAITIPRGMVRKIQKLHA